MSIHTKEPLNKVIETNTSSNSLSDFILQDLIGRGSFGKVYRAKDKHTKEIYAAKISIKAIEDDMQDLFKEISQEVNIISKLNHPSVLKFIFYSPVNFKQKTKPVIITEYASNGSLLEHIEHDRIHRDNPFLNDTSKLIIIFGIVSAMSYLHSHDILHRDLKPDNILKKFHFTRKHSVTNGSWHPQRYSNVHGTGNLVKRSVFKIK